MADCSTNRRAAEHNCVFAQASAVSPLFGVEARDRVGLDVAVTGLERTLVDLFDRPHLGGGVEEVWKSLATVEFFDLEAVTEYAALLGNATTVAKVGFFSRHTGSG